MKRISCISFFLLFFHITFPVYSTLGAELKRIDPEAFEWMLKTSLNIMKVYRHYNDLIEKYDPIFLFDVDSVQTFRNDYIIPTSLGPITTGPIQMDIALYGNFRIKDSYLGLLVIGNSFDLQIDEELHPDLRSTIGPYGDLYGWVSRYMIIAVRGGFKEDVNLTIGGLVKKSPYITTASDGSKYFSIFYDEEDREYKTNVEEDEFFLHANLYGYDIGTIYKFNENELTLFEFKRRIGKERGKLNIAFNYYGFLDTYQGGIEYTDFMPTNYISLGIEGFLNIHKKGHGTGLAYMLSTSSIYLFRDKRSKEEASKRDFHISINLGASYSKDIFDEGLFGYSWDVALEDISLFFIKSYGRFSFGESYNYHKTLYRIPIKDETLVFIGFQLML